MVYQPPTGARDLLPLDVAQKRWIEDRLTQVLHRWGYHRIITSTLERIDTLMAGGAIDRDRLIHIQSSDTEALGLRPEITASIARTAVTRLALGGHPQRLYYNANVFRRPVESHHSGQQEFYQAGVELLGCGEILADAEILLLLLDCLNQVSLGDRCELILGEAGLTRSLLNQFPEPLRAKVRRSLAQLDRFTLETLPMSEAERSTALMMFELRGQPEAVLEQVSQLPLNDDQRQRVTHLKALIELLQGSLVDRPQPLPVVLDLSLIRTFDYYTGLVFEIVSDGVSGQQVLGQGGRYDELLGTYHPQGESTPGIGFSLELERIHQVLLPTNHLPQSIPASDWLVVYDQGANQSLAFIYAQQLRNVDPNECVEVELGGRSHAEIRADAINRHIAKIAWLGEDGQVTTENLRETSD